jgi:zinc protease
VIGIAARESYISAAFLGPAISEPTDVCATDVLTMLLNHATFGRLQKSLLGDSPRARATGVDFLTQRDRGLVGVWAACDPSQVEAVKQTIRQELTRLAEEPVSPKELMLAKRQALAAYAFANETVSDRATTLAFYEALGNYREAAQYVQRLRTLTAAEVQKVARWYAGEPVWAELSAKEQTP